MCIVHKKDTTPGVGIISYPMSCTYAKNYMQKQNWLLRAYLVHSIGCRGNYVIPCVTYLYAELGPEAKMTSCCIHILCSALHRV